MSQVPVAIADVVIPTFNQADMTAACLLSLARMKEPERIRVIWVDNGSLPEQRKRVEEVLEELQLRHLDVKVDSNLGFVKATNAGIALSTAPTIVLLNNDTEVPSEWLDRFLEALEWEPKMGAVGPRSSSAHQWQGKIRTDGEWAKAELAVLGKHQMLAFFCVALRREVIAQVGYLSEEYRAGLGDDDDYCARMQAAGWQLGLRLDTTVLHHHRTTFREVYGEDGWLKMQEENLALFKRKWNR